MPVSTKDSNRSGPCSFTDHDSTRPCSEDTSCLPSAFLSPEEFSSSRSLRAKKAYAYTKNRTLCEATNTGRITVEHKEYELLLSLYWCLFEYDDKPCVDTAKRLIAQFEKTNVFYHGSDNAPESKQGVDPYDSIDLDGLDPYGQ